MAVHCPQCAYPAAVSAEIGPGGQLLTCEKCGTRWFARRFDHDPYGRDLQLVEVAEAEVVDEAGPPPDLRLLPPRWRAAPSPTSRLMERSAKIFGVVVAVFVAVAVFRTPIVAALPMLPTSSGLPVSVSALTFNKVRSELIRVHGVETLLVDGEVLNPTGGAIALPAIRIAVNSPDGVTVKSWLVEPTQDSVAPGGSVRFRSALAAPPETVSDITLNLERRPDRINGV